MFIILQMLGGNHLKRLLSIDLTAQVLVSRRFSKNEVNEVEEGQWEHGGIVAINVGPKVWKGRESGGVSTFGSFPCKSNIPIGESSPFPSISTPLRSFCHAFLTLVS